MAREKKGTYFKDKINRFRMLRYENEEDLTDNPSLTVDYICAKTGLSKGLVSKMEKQDLQDGDVPSCNASTIRAYHDKLGCSYEYLMGNSQKKTNEYHDISSDPILSALPDNFWNNLKLALTDEWDSRHSVDMERIAILRLLLSNPDSFKDLLDAIFNSLFEIYKLKQSPLPDYMITDNIAQREYALDQVFNRLLNQNVLPNLFLIFQKHEEAIKRYKENEDEILAELGKGFMEFMSRHNTEEEDSQ